MENIKNITLYHTLEGQLQHAEDAESFNFLISRDFMPILCSWVVVVLA